jgi:signal transduction histidine kinase
LVRFRYQLKGYDRDWVEAGRTRSVNYSQVRPGRYEFIVRAANNDGLWNETKDRLALFFEPAFWQTTWFRGLLVVLFLGSGSVLYLWRVRHLERRRAAQEAFSRKLIFSQEQERKRIAAELHDSLGQNLLVIKNRAALALTQKDQPEKMSAQMTEVSAMASNAIREVREIAQNLRPFQLDELGLTKSITAMVRKLADSSPIEFKTELDDIDRALPPEFEINFYRVLQECMNNIVKHSQATTASITLRRTDRNIHLTVTDNGRGFRPEKVMTGNAHGFGLNNIAERARTMRGEITFISHPGGGTSVEVVVPVD